MKIVTTLIFLFFTFNCLEAQDNFVNGRIILENGQAIEAQINDQLWAKIPESFEYRSTSGAKTRAFPKDVKEIKIGSKAIYRSFRFSYDSSSRIKDELTANKEPAYKAAHLFLKVLVDADVALLVAKIKNVERYFIQREDKAEELINHAFRNYVAGQEVTQENRLYIKQLTQGLSGYAVSPTLEYSEKALRKLFSDYSAYKGVAAQQFQKNEKPVVLKGVVGTLAYDRMIHNFDGGSGFGVGGFVTSYLPRGVYRTSVYTELAYRKFGNQSWTGVDYVGLPYHETHQVRSIKLTSIVRRRLSRKPSLPYAGYTYAGAGIAASFGLKDLYQRGPYVATKATPFAGIILNGGVYITRNVALDLKLERGSQIFYGDYLNQDNREPLSKGYYSFQGSIMIEF